MKIAVWYHCKIRGEGIPDEEAALVIMASQMHVLKESGLAKEATTVNIGINGNDSDALLVGCFAPDQTVITTHGPEARTEIPTMKLLRASLEPGWAVLYHHSKGVTHPGDALYHRWLGNMQRVCISNWRDCIQALAQGAEACGCHWLTPEKFPGAVSSPFFGGTFWWARSDYLQKLPALPEPTWANRYEAESWIGRHRPYPRVVDFSPGWPA